MGIMLTYRVLKEIVGGVTQMGRVPTTGALEE